MTWSGSSGIDNVVRFRLYLEGMVNILGLEMKKTVEKNTLEMSGKDSILVVSLSCLCKWRCLEFKGRGQGGELSAHKWCFMALDETTKRINVGKNGILQFRD